MLNGQVILRRERQDAALRIVPLMESVQHHGAHTDNQTTNKLSTFITLSMLHCTAADMYATVCLLGRQS